MRIKTKSLEASSNWDGYTVTVRESSFLAKIARVFAAVLRKVTNYSVTVTRETR